MPLAQFQESKEDVIDEEVENLLKEGLNENEEEMKKKNDADERQKKLFDGCKMFLSREVPREPMVFIIR